MDEKYLEPTGGPCGYLYNVRAIINKKGIQNINFIKYENEEVKKTKQILKKLITKSMKKYIVNYLLVSSILKEKKAPYQDFSQYEVIHFHNTHSLYVNRENIKNYSGKVLLTSHSPKPAHLEIINDQLTKLERFIYGKKLRKLDVIDRFSFERADYIIFPCEEAEEPYCNNWNEYKNIKLNKASSYKYVPTGSLACSAQISKEEIFERYAIPKNSFVICFVGRHNDTKGYDVLKDIGEKILEKYDNVYFLIVGKEEPLKGLNNKKWIEVGWTNDPHSIIAASDLFVLPNKETYFDLIMLEVLSLGKMVLAANTGGNKYFKKFNEKGIFYFESEEEAIKLIDRIIPITQEEKKKYEELNKKLFQENFTMDHFINNYLKVIDEVVKDK